MTGLPIDPAHSEQPPCGIASLERDRTVTRGPEEAEENADRPPIVDTEIPPDAMPIQDPHSEAWASPMTSFTDDELNSLAMMAEGCPNPQDGLDD
jgi:hypothetical protein